MTKNLYILFPLLLSSCYLGEDLPPDQEVWEYAHPTSAGMDADALYKINEGIEAEDFGAIKGLIIIHDDQLVFENYYDNTTRSHLQRMDKLTFSVITIILDLFVEHGYIASLDDPIFTYLPSYQSTFEADTSKKLITFRHILSHKTGLSWDETGRETNDYGQMRATDDWAGYILAKEMETVNPGQRFSLNSAGGIVIAKILQNTLEEGPLEDFIKEHFFSKIGISQSLWEKSPQGTLNGADGLRLSTIDMCRLAYLMILEGRWLEKRRVVRRDWIYDISREKSAFNENISFGYGWKVWTEKLKAQYALENTSVYYNDGGTGQSLFIVPEHKLIVTIAASNFFGDAESLSFALFLYIQQSLDSLSVN